MAKRNSKATKVVARTVSRTKNVKAIKPIQKRQLRRNVNKTDSENEVSGSNTAKEIEAKPETSLKVSPKRGRASVATDESHGTSNTEIVVSPKSKRLKTMSVGISGEGDKSSKASTTTRRPKASAKTQRSKTTPKPVKAPKKKTKPKKVWMWVQVKEPVFPPPAKSARGVANVKPGSSTSGTKNKGKADISDKKLYQLKITLLDTEPLIWRRILVPASYNFDHLKFAIHFSMGWLGPHSVHQFRVKNPVDDKMEYLISGEDEFNMYGGKAKQERDVLLTDYLKKANDAVIYQYTFGEAWEHEVLLEEILPLDPKKKYPKCIAGEKACPPLDSGGAVGYSELLKIIKNPKHSEYQESKDWLKDYCPRFRPDHFNPKTVVFRDL